MRLLILNYEFPPVGGGASTASYHSAMELVRHGHTVDVLTCRVAGQPSVERKKGLTVYRVLSIRKSPHDTGLFGVITYLCAAHFKLRRLLKTTSYDYAQFFFAVPTGLLSFQWRSTTNKPYIVSLRGSDVPGYDRENRLVGHLHRALRPVTRKILANAHCVVANSESLGRLAEQSFPEIPISVITNGVSQTMFKPAQANGNKTGDSINGLCVARLVRRKGIDHLLQAIHKSEISNLQISIAGVGPEQQNLAGLAEELGIQDRVEFLGQQSSEALAKHYRNADFLVHPALTESFSMTLLEAMASGLPVIAADVGGIPELVVNRENGILFQPGNIPALSKAMVDLCSDTAKRIQYAKNNRSKILSEFTWAHIVEQYLRRCFTDSAGDADPVFQSAACD